MARPTARTDGTESAGPYFVAAIRTAEGFGLIVASDFLLTSWTDLRIFHGMARDVRFEFQNLAASALLQDNEVLRVRNAIARDLHDSVAQALAGAKFWIGGLIEETGPANQREELVRLRDAMEMETSNLRSIIETLRTRDTLALATEFPAVLRETLGALQEQPRPKKEKKPAETDDERVARMKREKKEYREQSADRDDTEYITVVVWPDRARREQFAKLMGLDENERYMSGTLLSDALGLDDKLFPDG